MDLISKYMMKKEKREDIFHSSAYGKVQNGGTFGAASTESFKDRMKMEGDRQMVGGYGESRLANSAIGSGPHAKKYTPPEEQKAGGGASERGVKKNTNGIAPNKTVSPVVTESRKAFAPPIKPNFGR